MRAGTILAGKYVIQSVIGQGGMSTVYLAVDNHLGKRWAAKEISPSYCENFDIIEKRILLEADILKRLDHPSLPLIVDIIKGRGSLIIIMEFISGRTLEDILLDQIIIEERKVIDWGIQIADVLTYLHSQDPPIIYRDIKPSNIMVKDDGRIMLIDFGTAREFSGAGSSDTMCLGTRGYAAPEQYGGGGQTDFRTDIYGLGVTMYQMLTGKNPQAPPYRILPVRQLFPEVSAGMEEIINKCTHSDPKDRYANCRELKYALTHIEESSAEYYKKQLKRVRVAGIFFLIALLAFMLGKLTDNLQKKGRKDLIDTYMKQAALAGNDQERQTYYKKALVLMPDHYPTYREIISNYCDNGDFTSSLEAGLVSILNTPSGEGPCLEVLRKQNEPAYDELCYDLGIACFFEMGGYSGKRDAESWFRAVCESKEENVDPARYKRAGLYYQICRYYREFLGKDYNKSGEKKGKSYREFFRILKELNDIELDEKSDDSEVSAAFMISKEVLIEIAQYASQFAEDRIEVGEMRSQIDRIWKAEKKGSNSLSRMEILGRKKTDKEMQELKRLLDDAKRKLDVVEYGRDLKEG